MTLLDKIKGIFETAPEMPAVDTIFVKTTDGKIFLVKGPECVAGVDVVEIDSAGVEQTIEDGDYTYDFGAQAMRNIMKSDCLPDAIFCASDLIAFGAMDTARYEYNLRVPEDIAFIGCDDTAVAAYPPYSLTTVQQPVEDMIKAIIDILAGYDSPSTQNPDASMQVFSSKLVCRASA